MCPSSFPHRNFERTLQNSRRNGAKRFETLVLRPANGGVLTQLWRLLGAASASVHLLPHRHCWRQGRWCSPVSRLHELKDPSGGWSSSLTPRSRLSEFITLVRDRFEEAARQGESPVLVTSPAVRPFVRSIVERFRSQTSVLSQSEIHPRARLKTVGNI